MHQRIVLVSIAALLSLAAALPAWAAPPAQDYSCTEEYTVQTGDWLSTVADKYYGDPLAYTALIEATNRAALADPGKYLGVSDPAEIEVGQLLCIVDQAEAEAILAQQAALLEGTVVQPNRMLLIVGNRSQEETPSTFTLSGGVYGEGESFEILPGQEVDLQLEPGDYTGSWQSPLGTVTRQFEAVPSVITIVWTLPENNQIFAENEWAGSLAGSPRGETELGFAELPSVQSIETPYDSVETDIGILVAGNISHDEVYAQLTLNTPTGQTLEYIINPRQETILMVEPGLYRATWESLDYVTNESFSVAQEFVVEADQVTVVWIVPETRFAYVQSPGLPGQMME